jgi:DNA-binding CsgD family transcriptional regulator
VVTALATSSGELAAARCLDAEDATMRQALAWAGQHDPAAGLRIAVALGNWRVLRGRLAEGYPLLLEAVRHAEVGSERWCAAQVWLGWTALGSADPSAAIGHFTALRDAFTDRPPSRALADALVSRSAVLRHLGQNPEAAAEARQALALAREVGYPSAEAVALADLSLIALNDGELDNAVQLARQAVQIPAEIPGMQARLCSFVLTQALVAAGDLTGAGRFGATALARAREVGDQWNLLSLLQQMAILELQAGRTAAAAHLNEAIQIGLRADDLRRDLSTALDRCGHLCAQTGRPAEALTMWAAFAAVLRHAGIADELADARPRHEPLRRARQALGTARARAAEERGAAMSLDTAAEYALMLTTPGAQAPTAAAGAGKLSARERELVTLVAQGHTNAQIAAQLHISIRTVSSHLDRIRDKTGCRRRADLTRLALSTGLI